MAFFLVGRSRDDASLTLLSVEAFDTKDLAARAVRSIAITGHMDVDTVDVFIADLGAATPVVLVGLPASAPMADEAAAGVWETPGREPIIVLESVVVEEPEPIAETDVETISDHADDPESAVDEIDRVLDVVESEPDTLTAALERATSSMAADGIVPPESVGFSVLIEGDVAPSSPVLGDEEPLVVDVPEEPDEAEPMESTTAPGPDRSEDLSAVIASLSVLEDRSDTELPPSPEDVAETPGVVVDDETWPWLNVGEVEPLLARDEDAELPVDPASVSEVTPTVVPEPEPELEPEPVPEPVFEPEPEPELEPEPLPEPVFEPEPELEPEPVPSVEDAPYVSTTQTDEGFSPKPVIMGDYSEPTAAEAPTPAYEPSGELSLADYTCADCIYSNTCPKVNESTPEECGSFQWKAL
jgi:hypothetical protein